MHPSRTAPCLPWISTNTHTRLQGRGARRLASTARFVREALAVVLVVWITGAHASRVRAAGTYELIGWGASKPPNSAVGPIQSVAVGYYGHALVLLNDGSLASWGDNFYGQATPPAGNTFKAISAGPTYNLALKTDGSIVGWGYAPVGQTNAPPGVFTAIAAASTASLGLKADGSLAVWGLNAGGVLNPPAGTTYVAIAAGESHFLALKADGSIVAWGDNFAGQTNVPAGTDFTAVSAAGLSNLAMKKDGSIAAWGQDGGGQPMPPPAGTGFSAIAAGPNHSLALRSDGSLVGWGNNDWGQATPPAGNDFVAIAAGATDSIALKTDGTVVGWGRQLFGLPPPFTGLVAVVSCPFSSAGSVHSLALTEAGAIIGWGNNSFGQATPPAGSGFTAIATGYTHSLALQADGSIVGWGNNDLGQTTVPAGTGFTALAAAGNYGLALKEGAIVAWGQDAFGVTTPPAGSDFTAIAAGGNHAVALKTDGSIVAWGANDYGQATPPPGTGFKAIAAGAYHNLALTADGTVVAWGRSGFGATVPPAGIGFTAIAAGEDHSVALSDVGAIIEWGNDGDAFDGPLDPPSGSGFTRIAAGPNFALALRDPSSTPPAPAPRITAPSPRIVIDETVTVAVAIDGDATNVDRVNLYFDGALVGFKTTAPFQIVVSNVTSGAHELVAQAVLTAGQGTALGDRTYIYRLTGAATFSDVLRTLVYLWTRPSGSLLSQAKGTSGHVSVRTLFRAMAAQVADAGLELIGRLDLEHVSQPPKTAAGQYYGDLGSRISVPMMELLLVHPAQAESVLDALVEWAPAVTALLDKQGATMNITPGMATAVENMFSSLRSVATGELAQVLDAEHVALDPISWSGMSLGGLRARVETQVRPPPDIVIHPTTQAFAAGGTLALSVTAGGAGPYAYQWLKDGVAITGAVGANYIVPSAQRFHAGGYSVTVSNPFGSNTSNIAVFSVSAPGPSAARLLNLSTRGLAQTGDNVLIPGFVINGTGTKKLLIRAVGPTLGKPPFNLGGVLPDPRLRLLKRNTGTGAFEEIATNDNWGANINAAAITQTAADLFAFAFNDSLESALLTDLAPGEYTVIAGGVNNVTGLAIVELYDADSGTPTSRLINISNRGFCGTGDQVMIPGFVISSEGTKTLLVRVIGPSLAGFNVPGTMTDPKLEIYPGGGSTPILANDNWGDNPDAAYTAQIASQVSAFPLDPGSNDAAFVVTLPPGVYTVIGSSATASGTGVMLVEIYVVP